MKYYQCDLCGNVTSSELGVELKGVTGTSGGILLPERLQEKHFCNPDCFWKWIHKYDVEKTA